MEDDLLVLYTKLSLTEKESEDVVIESENLEEVLPRGEKCLFMQLFTGKYFNWEAFKGMMRKIWRTIMGVCFRDLSSTMFLVEFDDVSDKENVLREGPWTFDKHLVLFAEADGRLQVQQIKLETASFWVRLHDLPIMARNVHVGQKLGEKIDIVEEVDLEKGEVEWGEYLRVRVKLNVNEPLLRGSKLSVGGGQSVWIRFSYERLPNLC
ncbi:uncharacterized protein LOC122298799 [Carya illinoinensis]|uniref:uncharacterized protein LOC122298799 n=1 Tax=Carya illinoinensis TaxID=32201 RepID=UPI001C727817|nr:uncharacterized protein LOC122298799 [Carya illinoinensis]